MIKTTRGNTSLACAALAAGLLTFSAQSLFAANATVKGVRGNPKYMGSNGFAVTLKKGDTVPSGAVIKTGTNESIDLAIGEKGRLVSVAPNSRIKLAEDNSLSLEKGELVGSFRKTSSDVTLSPVTLRTPAGVTQLGVGDISVNADTGTYTLLSGNATTFQPIGTDGAPAAPVSIPSGSVARSGGGNRVTVSQMSADLTANLLARVDSLNNVDQSLGDLKKKPSGSTPPPTTTPASPEPEPGGDGTGTQGFWKNHPEDWPITSITIGGVVYTREQAIQGMQHSTNRDMTYAMFQQLVAARLNILAGNTGTCITTTLAQADAWMAAHALGSRVSGSSTAWTGLENGNAIMTTLDNYNNGRMCAPHRD